MSEKYVCLHAHFYQPPRENPWLEEVESSYRHIIRGQLFAHELFPYHQHADSPGYFPGRGVYIVNLDLRRALDEEVTDIKKLEGLIEYVNMLSFQVDSSIGVITSSKITSLMKALTQDPEDTSFIERLGSILSLLKKIPVELGLWEAQNFTPPWQGASTSTRKIRRKGTRPRRGGWSFSWPCSVTST